MPRDFIYPKSREENRDSNNYKRPFTQHGPNHTDRVVASILTLSACTCTLVHVSTHYDIALCKSALIDQGWEQKDVAERSGMSESAVSKFFRGETVRNSTAAAIIRTLGLRVKDARADSPHSNGGGNGNGRKRREPVGA